MTQSRENMLELPLVGKVALITGGSRGIGLATAKELARRGASIAFNYMRNHKAARAAEQDPVYANTDVLKIRANIADKEAVDTLIETVYSHFGRLDIVINNAASGVMRTASETEQKHWDWTMQINARAPWMVAVRAAKVMGEGGKIINVSSPGSARVISPPYFAVGVSKAALEAVTRYLALELGGRGIAVNTVSAGFVMTDAIDAFPEKWEVRKIAARPTPAGRSLTADDVAKVIAMMCGEDASMIRGQVILVDGGETLRVY